MSSDSDRTNTEAQKCPECRAVLKRRRGRRADACEMICGGCGQIFDVCDTETQAALKASQE